ncbi:DUF5615 family PIN-like protein [cf. Phormidesmis sp. LEGE 11477]|nr:DUF5615 family PIN-like protein [cf. Phormidesmis sp. LEGE 11477]
MSIPFYMDENVFRQITVGLRLRGVDVLTVQEDERAGMADSQVIERSTELQRVLFSMDDDLLVLAHQRQREGIAFTGVVYTHPQSMSIGDCVKELEIIAKASTLEEAMNQVQYLPF